MDIAVHDVRKANWYNIINECHNRPVGMSEKQWLSENRIPKKTYYYWQRKYRNEILGQARLSAIAPKQEVAFAEITVPNREISVVPSIYTETNIPAEVIRCKGLTIEISNDISDVLLNRLLQEVSNA